jgi:ribosome-associated heat shock protein Hsp15
MFASGRPAAAPRGFGSVAQNSCGRAVLAADRHPSRKTSGWVQPASAYRITVCRVAGDQAGRVDSWIWSVRLARTRSAASVACRAGHVRVNGVRVKPAHAVRAGDEVRLRGEGRERVVVVQQVITKRVSAPVAAACYIDNSPPPPPREEAVPVAARDRGAGRPTKRERRSIEKLLGRPTR